MATEIAESEVHKIEKERGDFKLLVARNPNYFGNLVESPFKPVKKIVANTKYEELTCVGFNPDTNLLEATIAVKLPFGYNGNLCQFGSNEYVRFFVDYGSGWIDAGVVAVNVHDIANKLDCAKRATKPLTYVVTQKLDPKQDQCKRPVLPKVHAILSWQVVPPPLPGWLPVWGNTRDCRIQIKPRKKNLFDFVDILSLDVGQKLKLPKEFEAVAVEPIPQPDPGPLSLAELSKMYHGGNAKAGRAAKLAVEPHRFGLAHIQAELASNAFNQETFPAKIAEWQSLGLSWQDALVALDKTKADISYEEIECLGLDYNLERAIATFRVKKPVGYSGDLCHKGSLEYVAFWADWDDTCKWSYLGMATVNVHDIAAIPPDGLCYSAILPVDLTHHRQNCELPKIARLRAVLSWSSPPSTVDPDALNHWGNRLDTHVQIKPGEHLPPGMVKPIIGILGGIPISKIDLFSGMTTPTAFFALNGIAPDSLGRPCPFGGRVVLQGPSFPGFKYRVQVRNLTAAGPWTTVTTTMKLVDWTGTVFTNQVANPAGFFTFVPFPLNVDNVLAWWDSTGDDLWEIRLQLADMLDNLLPGVASHRIQLDNTGPEVAIHIDSGGDCGKYKVGNVLNGHFVARDTHLGSWSLSTSPFAGPVVPASGLVQTVPAPGDAWTLNTAGMKPCGYIVGVSAVDRTIVNSAWVGHWAWASAGFCLEKP